MNETGLYLETFVSHETYDNFFVCYLKINLYAFLIFLSKL